MNENMTPTMIAIEREHDGMPLSDILGDYYLSLGSWAAVARSLDVSRATLFLWRARLGISEADAIEAVRARDRAPGDTG